MKTQPTQPTREQALELARLIKRSHVGRGWCSTTPMTISLYLLAHGVTVPDTTSEEAKR